MPMARQNLVGPFRHEVDAGETFRRGEGGARVDHRDIEPACARHRRKRLRDMHRADDDQPRRRQVHGDEALAPRRFLGAALAGQQDAAQPFAVFLAVKLGLAHEPLLAAADIGDHQRRAAVAPLLVQRLEQGPVHFPNPPLCLNHLLDKHADTPPA